MRYQSKIIPAVFLAAFICACTISAAGPANDSASDSSGHRLGTLLKQDVHLTVGNVCATLTAPLHWNGRSWAYAGIGLGAVGCTFAADAAVQRFVQSHTSSGADRLIFPWRHYGQWYTAAAISGGMYLSGLGFSNQWLRETGRSALTALALNSAITGLMKFTFGRSRPYNDIGPFIFKPYRSSDDNWSFPSGHTATAFTLSSVLASRIGNTWATLGLYGAAALTATERIYEDHHWLSDAVLGAMIGTAIGRFVAGSSKKDSGHSGARGITLEPIVTSAMTGVCVVLSY
jgi:membrane-associated phospholipid phosphatase